MTGVRTVLVLAMLGCSSPPPAPKGTALADGVSAERIAFAGATFDVVTVDLDRARVRALARDAAGAPIGRFGRLRERVGPTLVAATNAGIFEPGLVPTGLFVADGVEIAPLNTAAGEGNFYLAPNGVFAVDDAGAWIAATAEFRSEARRPRQATQSGPLLVSHGVLHAAFRPDSTSAVVRNGVGVISPRRIALVISRSPVNLYTFARFLRDQLGCRDALYLDGTISGLYVPSAGGQDLDRGPFAGFLAIERP